MTGPIPLVVPNIVSIGGKLCVSRDLSPADRRALMSRHALADETALAAWLGHPDNLAEAVALVHEVPLGAAREYVAEQLEQLTRVVRGGGYR